MPAKTENPDPARPDRIFFSENQATRPAGWYYYAREGIFGPFQNREDARQDLAGRKKGNPRLLREIFKRLGLGVRDLKD